MTVGEFQAIKAKNTEMGGIPGLETGGKGLSSRGDPGPGCRAGLDGFGGCSGGEPGLGRGQSKGTPNTRPDSALEKEKQVKVCKAKKQPAGKQVMTGQWTRGRQRGLRNTYRQTWASSSPSLCSS